MGDCWDLDNMEVVKGDCLPFIRKLFIDLYLHRFTKICTLVFLTIHVPIWVVQFHFFADNFSANFIAQYMPCALIFFYAFTAMLIPVVYEKHIREYTLSKNKTFWSLTNASSGLKDRLEKQAIFTETVTKINVVLAFLTYICVLLRYLSGNEWEIMYQVTFLKNILPGYAPILVSIFYISLAYLIVPMLLMVYVLAYFTIHTYFQAKMLNERVSKITENYTRSIILAYDKGYQHQVHSRLLFCVKYGLHLKRYAESAISILPPLVVTYFLLGVLLVICYTGTWYLDPDKYYPLFFMISITTGYTVLVAVEIGQLIENESVATYQALIRLPWYIFSVKNQKILLFILIHANLPVRISPYETFPVNRRLLVQFYKIISSVSALLANSRKWISK